MPRQEKRIQEIPIGEFFVSSLYPSLILRRNKDDMQVQGHIHATVMTYSDEGHEPGSKWFFDIDTVVYHPVTAKEEARAREHALKRLVSLSEELGFDL